MSQSGLLEITHDKLLWPSPAQILKPTGVGPGIYAQLAREKVGNAIVRDCLDAAGVNVGILTTTPEGDETESPLAIVCDFKRPISQATLCKVYTLAWSFSRAQALITVEPHLLRVWTCCEEPPSPDQQDALKPVSEIKKDELLSFGDDTSLAQQAAASLYWVELVSGNFFQQHEERFRKSRAADQMLLSNLKSVRSQLQKLRLEDDIIHDLLARLIFIQFLFHRKDSFGKSALNANFLKTLHQKNILTGEYQDLSEILTNYKDTYAFFRELNDKFNGDLFPGKSKTTDEREKEWQKEEQRVSLKHLKILSDFVRGDLEMEKGQRCLWPFYSFDAVPLDFISSIYEEFVSKPKGGNTAHYTPGHLVDFILDGVLPWDGEEWNVKVLDPSCGSGIFLVKAFQRLIYRWKSAHPDEEIRSKTLKSMLERNIFGVDLNRHAVRVASFSLYLTMCDAIDPRHYWKTVKFPRLRERNLLTADFFREDIERIRTGKDAGSYDLVIGNAPWEEGSVTLIARDWAKTYEWEVTYKNVGPLFLSKAVYLARAYGRVSMIQPSGALIFNQVNTARKFREKLFSEFKIEEVVNLSALRFGLFKSSISPSCIITLQNHTPNGEPLSYICPKPVRSNEDDFRIIIEPQDINSIFPQEAIAEPLVWTALMWGGRRDLAFIQRLSKETNLAKLEKDDMVASSQGIIRGSRQKHHKAILGRPILENSQFPYKTFIYLNTRTLHRNNDPCTHRLTNLTAFDLPQLVIKLSWIKEIGRFKAVLIKTPEEKIEGQGIICSGSYVSVHTFEPTLPILETAWLSYNSKLCAYYLLLSSGRFASFIPETKPKELLQVPIPALHQRLLENIRTLEDIDQCIRQAFAFKDSEWTLIEDLFNYTLPDFKGDNFSPGRQKTHRQDEGQKIEPELQAYCEYFMRVLKAGFGQDKQIGAAIFQEQTTSHLPVRLTAFYLNQPPHEGIKVEPIDSPILLKRLAHLNETFIEQGQKEGIFYQRVARIYISTQINGRAVPTVYFVKPDKIRYWTRSMALRDADEVAAELMLSRNSVEKGTGPGTEE